MGPQLANPSKRYVLTSFAYGCGLGPAQASRHFKEPVPPHLLTFANRRHMGADTLRAASNDLINFYASFELPSCWGSGESAAADGTMVPTYDNNLFAAHHVRYGRTGGIAYRHIADNYVALFSHFIPCGVHETVYILDGLLKNTSEVQPSRLDDLRSGVTDAANKVEPFHQFSSHLRFGNHGLLRTNEPDEQEKAIIYNELVANAVMLQTVADQTRVLRDLHCEGYPVSKAYIAYLSPYVTEQLKRFGEYPTRCETEPPPSRKWSS